MRIAIGSDHGGMELKNLIVSQLQEAGHEVMDQGCHSLQSVDYPDFAELVCRLVEQDQSDRGILICGTGIGMSIAANRRKTIRAALCHELFTTRMSREHNNANVLCLGARVIGPGLALEMVDLWLKTEFAGGRHQQRIDKMS
ncbi:ribose 5-phosphate isomerase B [Thermodesulfobacteriota bacterium]